jgi:hypothetical protein
VTTTVYLLNRKPTKSVAGKTPFKAWHGHKPKVEHLRTFGSIAYVKMTRPHLKKLDDRSTAKVFISYKPGTKAWRFYDLATRRVYVSRDALFQEQDGFNWSDEYTNETEWSPVFAINYAKEEVLNTPGMMCSSPACGVSPPATMSTGVTTPTFLSPPPDAREYLDFDNNVMPCYCSVNDVIGSATPPGPIPKELEDELHLQIGKKPTTFKEAMHH